MNQPEIIEYLLNPQNNKVLSFSDDESISDDNEMFNSDTEEESSLIP